MADIETHELLYLNDLGSAWSTSMPSRQDMPRRAAAPRDEAVWQTSAQRPSLLFDDHVEHVNPITGHRYPLKDRLIDWEDVRPASRWCHDGEPDEEEDLRVRSTRAGLCAHDLYGASDAETAARNA